MGFLCCWLVPPEPSRAVLEALIAETAQRHALPAFGAHITLLGPVGVDVPVAEALQKLQGLAGTGAVPVRFRSIETRPPWNQYCVAVAEETPELCRLQRLARQAFLGTPEAEAEVAWAPPLGLPHLSLVYGTGADAQSGIAASLPLPDGFEATEISLVDCSPTSLEGVPEWTEVGRVSL